MTSETINTTKGLCVVALTKNIMERLSISQEAAYKKLLTMTEYKLLMDEDTRLFLEPNDFLCDCCNKELEEGAEAVFAII